MSEAPSDPPERTPAAKSDAAPEPKSKSMLGSVKAKLEGLIAEYGAIAIVVYFGIFFSVWAGFAFAIAMGVSVDLGDAEVGAGTLGIIAAAYVPTKLTQPVRIGATLILTPVAASLLDRLRLRRR